MVGLSCRQSWRQFWLEVRVKRTGPLVLSDLWSYVEDSVVDKFVYLSLRLKQSPLSSDKTRRPAHLSRIHARISGRSTKAGSRANGTLIPPEVRRSGLLRDPVVLLSALL
jgi:hypothetical protein